jgi:hypothetical protein
MEKSTQEGHRLVSTFRHWAELGRKTRAGRLGRKATWEGVSRMISAAQVLWRAESDELCSLLMESNRRLAPLADPLLSDFDLHRWLAEEREEIYSDWLEWVLKQLPSLRDVFDVLGIRWPEEIASESVPTFETKREMQVTLPHWGSHKKLDLVVRRAGRVLVVIEVKKTSAEDAYVAKQEEYAAWAEREPETSKYLVLLAEEGQRPEYYKFRLRPYRDLCLALRQKVPPLIENKHISLATAALVLAYVGAVEQNLLGLSSGAARRAINQECVPTTPELIDYLERFLGRGQGHE